MTIETPRHDIASIQILRGIAATMIVVFHAETQLLRMGYDGVSFAPLAAGVDIFFLISGFIMWVSAEQHPRRSAGQFLLNRIQRIVPLYWAMTLAVAAICLVRPQLFQSTVLEPAHLLKSLLFIAAPNPATGRYEPFLVPGWTLNNEMAFYLLFAVAIAVGAGRWWLRALVAGALILASAAVPLLLPTAPGAVLFYGQNIVLEFLLGLLLGIVYTRGRFRQGGAGWVMCAVGWLALFYLGYAWPAAPRILQAGLPATLIVAGAVFGTSVRSAIVWLGDISYSLYLTHGIVLSALGQAWRTVGLADVHLLFVITATVIAIVGGALTYRLVERPMLALVKRRRQR